MNDGSDTFGIERIKREVKNKKKITNIFILVMSIFYFQIKDISSTSVLNSFSVTMKYDEDDAARNIKKKSFSFGKLKYHRALTITVTGIIEIHIR